MVKKKVVKKEKVAEKKPKVDLDAPNHPVTERYGEPMKAKYGGGE